jgi:hypothetical protein
VVTCGAGWVNLDAQLRSIELFGRYVMPHFQGQLKPQYEAHRYLAEHKEEIVAGRQASRAHAQ